MKAEYSRWVDDFLVMDLSHKYGESLSPLSSPDFLVDWIVEDLSRRVEGVISAGEETLRVMLKKALDSVDLMEPEDIGSQFSWESYR